MMYGEMVYCFKVVKNKIVSKGDDDFMVPGDTELPIMDNGAR